MPATLFFSAVAAVVLLPAAAQAQKLSGIGDSISQGYNANCPSWFFCGEQPSYSFGQGTSSIVNSLYLRGGFPQKQFVSVSGAEMVGGSNNAAAQASRICAQATRPTDVVLELGGNDVCNRGGVSSMYSVTTWGNALQAAIDTLAPCLPAGARVHVLSMPRVDFLYDAGNQAGCGIKWYLAALFGARVTCQIVTTTSPATRAQVGARIDQYNEEIRARVEAARVLHRGIRWSTDWRGSRAQGFTDTSVGTYRFSGGDVAPADCFHPYRTGQCKLACIGHKTWNGLNSSRCFASSTCAQ
jgi:hypothetical protein